MIGGPMAELLQNVSSMPTFNYTVYNVTTATDELDDEQEHANLFEVSQALANVVFSNQQKVMHIYSTSNGESRQLAFIESYPTEGTNNGEG